MAKGAIAKEKATEVIVKALGSHLVGIFDKKIYAEFEENGDMVQVAIALTCPKVPVSAVPTNNDWTNEEVAAAPTSFVPAEITEEEQNNLAKLIDKLNL